MATEGTTTAVDAATTTLLSELQSLQSQLRGIWNRVEGHREELMAAWKGNSATAFNKRIENWENDFINIEAQLDKLGSGVQGYQKRMFEVDQMEPSWT